ncbi:MAG: hypothetical protein OQK98_01605 [Gammaproteobacteria bacterium]|nr:hypothetical protein [Gammaproteobacteria bacterium]
MSSLRKADQLTARAESFETMLLALRDKQSHQSEILAEVQLLISSLLNEADNDDQKKLLNEMQVKLNTLG